jgi:hypothetical protein
LVRAVTDHDRDSAGLERECGGDDAIEERLAGNRMQDFWQLRFHPRALSCRQNDYMNVGHVIRRYQVYGTFLLRSSAA